MPKTDGYNAGSCDLEASPLNGNEASPNTTQTENSTHQMELNNIQASPPIEAENQNQDRKYRINRAFQAEYGSDSITNPDVN